MPALQDGKKIPKWQPRSRRGQFVGWSPMHASSVGLIRNLMTGRLSPQFHVVFDPWFETVVENGEVPPETWDVLMTHNQFEVDIEPGSESYEVQDDWLTKEELAEKKARAQVQQAELCLQPKIKQEGMMNLERATEVQHFLTILENVRICHKLS